MAPNQGLEWTNKAEVLEGLKRRKEAISSETLKKVAKQMGVIAVNNIKPLCAVKTGNWRDSIHAEVNPISETKVELWVGSHGAFSEKGFNYGAMQEYTRHPIAIGWHQSIPDMTDRWMTVIHGVSTGHVELGSEFEVMSGMM